MGACHTRGGLRALQTASDQQDSVTWLGNVHQVTSWGDLTPLLVVSSYHQLLRSLLLLPACLHTAQTFFVRACNRLASIRVIITNRIFA